MRLPAGSRVPSRLLSALLTAIVVLLSSPAAEAQSVSIIRDAEVEAVLHDFTDPLFKAAGLRVKPKIYIVGDRRFNAFVVEDGSIFVNYGTIIESETPNELKAVLAHEIGHLAGGHLARIRQQTEINGRLQVMAMLLGAGAIAASAGHEGSEVGEMASAFIIASQSVGRNSLLAFRRDEESAADNSAIQFLDRAGQSAKGMVDVLERLSRDQVARAGASGYLSTHPLPQERLDQVEKLARSKPHWSRRDSASDISKLAYAKAKLVGFLEPRTAVLNRYPNADKSAPALYARIITAYKGGAGISAIPQMARLAASNPSNPYFQELLGQMYFETGQPQKAVPPIRKALSLAPDESQIRILYGQALIDAGNSKEAVLQLTRALHQEPKSERALNLMSRAYANLGRQGEATLYAAEAALARDEKGLALGLARKAQQQLNSSSPAWLRADDIILSLK